jgi:putative protease
VEGRNKTEYYAGVVARAYRRAIDDYYRSPQEWDYRNYLDEFHTLQNRGYCLGFYDGRPDQNYQYTRTLGDWLFAGSIIEWQGDDMIFELRNCLEKGEWVEFLVPGSLDNIRIDFPDGFEDAKTGAVTDRVSAGQHKTIRIKPCHCHCEERSDKAIPANLKKLLPPLTLARKPNALTPENRNLLAQSKKSFHIV